MTANDKTGVGSGSGEWQTPPDLFRQLHRLFHFDIDLFASPQNCKTAMFCSEEGTFLNTLTYGPMFKSSSDGLTYRPEDLADVAQKRGEGRAFSNPPYSRGFLSDFAYSFYQRRGAFDIHVALVPASTETEWFRQLERSSLPPIYLHPRVKFIDPETGEPGTGPPQGNAVFVSRPSWMDR